MGTALRVRENGIGIYLSSTEDSVLLFSMLKHQQEGFYPHWVVLLVVSGSDHMICECVLYCSPSRSALRDPETPGRPIQHVLRLRPHQAQPAHPQSGHQPGARGAHPLHVLAALLLRAQIRYVLAPPSVLQFL